MRLPNNYRITMAKNYEEFRQHGKEMVDYLCDYMSKIGDYPVAPTIDPGFLVPLLAGSYRKSCDFRGK